MGFTDGSVSEELACTAAHTAGLIWVRKIPWRRKRQPTPVFLVENYMDRGAWWATVHGVAKSWRKLSDRGHTNKMPIKTFK